MPNQYRLYEAVYESPFYWMMGDRKYAATHADHRGAFLEKAAAHLLKSVFGKGHVHENVILKQNSRDVAGEIDVLVVYGEFVIVVQAKSKRVTQKARSGDTASLQADFEGAIQDPYRQALACIDLIKSGAKCIAKDGSELAIPSFLPNGCSERSFPRLDLSFTRHAAASGAYGAGHLGYRRP